MLIISLYITYLLEEVHQTIYQFKAPADVIFFNMRYYSSH